MKPKANLSIEVKFTPVFIHNETTGKYLRKEKIRELFINNYYAD